MNEPAHALISLEQRFADAILDGTKLVELRRRPMRVSVGTTVWLYAKVPIGKVVGSARVLAQHELAPSTLWRRYGNVSGLTKTEFVEYFAGVKCGFVLVLDAPKRMARPLSLESLRSLSLGFQPPQFFHHLADDGPLVAAFTAQACS